jgi:hypothetical protein
MPDLLDDNMTMPIVTDLEKKHNSTPLLLECVGSSMSKINYFSKRQQFSADRSRNHEELGTRKN